MKKIKLTENDLNNLIKKSVERILEGRNVTNLKGYRERIKPMLNKLSQDLYGDQEGTINQRQTDMYDLENHEVLNSLQIKSGLFSIGNAKLSPDTLIINFTSGLNCPSVKVCPVTQMACYAVAGEIRLPDVRKKNLMIQNMWYRAIQNDKVSEVFGIAQTYIDILKNTQNPIRYIRFNEVGDFINQKILDAAALFAYEMKNKYGVMSMAYTANNRLDFTKKIKGKTIDKIIKINASRLDIKLSKKSIKNSFLAIPMDFESALLENDKVVSINEDDLKKNNLKCLGVKEDPSNGTPSIPILAKGKWSGGSGWYYVCPCSFWGFNKTKATIKKLKEFGLIDDSDKYLSKKELNQIEKKLTEEQKNEIKSVTNKIKSPCGVQCAVCHNMIGGISLEDSTKDPSEWKMKKNFTVLEATHGATSGNFRSDYANAKRASNDTVEYDSNNKYGRLKKFTKDIIDSDYEDD